MYLISTVDMLDMHRFLLILEKVVFVKVVVVGRHVDGNLSFNFGDFLELHHKVCSGLFLDFSVCLCFFVNSFSCSLVVRKKSLDRPLHKSVTIFNSDTQRC